MSKQSLSKQKRRIKILKFCASATCKIVVSPERAGEIIALKKGVAVLRSIPTEILYVLMADGLITFTGTNVAITKAGKMHLRRALSMVDEFQQQHRLSGIRKVSTNGIVVSHRSNEGESPLTRLRFRAIKSGEAYIDDTSFQAGERLRADFTRGQLTQQLTSNWNVSQSEAGGSNGRNGIADLTDTALAARDRTQSAIVAVGPEFAGVLIDICCFLKGLELVEKERQWPPRSAKLMLKTGLSILARHYGISNNHNNSKQAPMRHWGNENFKPEMFPGQ